MKVLVAEVETLIRVDVRGLLEESGFDVCEARDGEEAVRLAREERPDAALVDVQMPGVDGIEATRQIRAERDIPIVLLTAHAGGDVVDRALAAGVSAYLVKPYGARDLVPALRTAVEQHRQLLAASTGRRPAATPGARRDEVLAAAARIFAEKGFAGTTIQNLADAVGVLKGSLYHYFSSKDGLLCDVVARADDRAWGPVEAAASGGWPGLRRLGAVVGAQLDALARDPAGFALLLAEHLGVEEESCAELAARRDRYVAVVRGILAAGQDDGSIRQDVDRDAAAAALLAALRGPPGVAATSTRLMLGGLAA